MTICFNCSKWIHNEHITKCVQDSYKDCIERIKEYKAEVDQTLTQLNDKVENLQKDIGDSKLEYEDMKKKTVRQPNDIIDVVTKYTEDLLGESGYISLLSITKLEAQMTAIPILRKYVQ